MVAADVTGPGPGPSSQRPGPGYTIPEPKEQRADRRRRGSTGGRSAGLDRERYRRRNEVERTINRLKDSRAVATRHDKRAYVLHGTVTAAANS